VAPRYSEEAARDAIASSLSYAEALRRLGMCDRGGSWRVLQRWVAIWDIPTDHFDPYARSAARAKERGRPLEALLVDGSTIGSSKLKQRLYDAGLKTPVCELCGQGEMWQGRRMSLILDHVNGKRADNRLANLRIVCPNCNATLDTHCGRNAAILSDRTCERCSRRFRARSRRQRFCSRECGIRWDRHGIPRPGGRRVERPPYEQLLVEVRTLGWSGTGRKYGVSDNAIRKWVRAYEAERVERRDEAA
jgi:hypothetical protein